jgi:hypothetical protein
VWKNAELKRIRFVIYSTVTYKNQKSRIKHEESTVVKPLRSVPGEIATSADVRGEDGQRVPVRDE